MKRLCSSLGPKLTVTVDPEPMNSADARRLVAALDAGLAELYRPEQRFGPNLKAEQLAGGGGEFFIARDGAKAVGCGAIRVLEPTTAEIKRMYVEPEQRGKGVGRAILVRLELAARRVGVRRLVLETGIYQEAAIALYRQAGFRKIPCWDEYLRSETSVCFEKPLA